MQVNIDIRGSGVWKQKVHSDSIVILYETLAIFFTCRQFSNIIDASCRPLPTPAPEFDRIIAQTISDEK